MVFNEEPQWGIFCRQMIVAFEIKKSSFSSYSERPDRHKIKLGYYGVIALISLTKCGKIEWNVQFKHTSPTKWYWCTLISSEDECTVRYNQICILFRIQFYDIKWKSTIYMQMRKNSFPIKVVKRVRKDIQ